ncbi:hypothetical protein BDR04DRAFT_1118341 [Suillus decipiens]|nr:hypothetical protein BDR04DRAFT_1118341 [Suillus decipiens]
MSSREHLTNSVVLTDNQDVYVFGLYDGNFMKLKDEDGSMVQEISCKSVIGHAAVHSKQGVFIVDNAADGFTLYPFEGDTCHSPSKWHLGKKASHCTIASTLTVLGCGKTTIKIWVYDYTVQKASKMLSENYWSLSHILMMLTQLLALLSMSVFPLMNYKGSFLDSAVDHVHGYMTSVMMVNVANEFSQHVKAAMKFGEYVYIEDNEEGLAEGSIKHDIRMLWELAAKLMEMAQEAGGEINEDDGKHDTDYPKAVKEDELTKSISLIQ